jgi:methyl-accepting chemotaxis protein
MLHRRSCEREGASRQEGRVRPFKEVLVMIRSCCLKWLLPAVALFAASLSGGPTASAEAVPALDARVALDGFRAAVEARLKGVRNAARSVAATQEARSGDWQRVQAPLAALASGVGEAAAVWFALPDGRYWTVGHGLADQSLRDRAYFPALAEGKEVVGALVISKSTGARALIVASPVLVDGKMAGAVGVSIDAAKLAAELDAAIRFPPNVVFYALDSSGETALHRAGELIFAFPSEQGSPTLSHAVETMLSSAEGIVPYEYGGSLKTAVFARSPLTGWTFVLGIAQAAK